MLKYFKYIGEKAVKKLNRLLFVLLSLTLVFALFACGKCEHKDEDGDGVCDLCEELLESVKIERVTLIEDGVPSFRFVVGSDIGSESNKVLETLIKDLKKLDIEIQKVNESVEGAQDVEVLIGTVTTRGEDCRTDKHALGSKGYVIKIVGSKIVINAGSDKQLALAIEEFGNDILGLADDPEELTDVVMTSEQNVEEIQSGYKVTALKIGEVDIKGYTIAVDSTNLYYSAAARFFQNLVYERTGYWLEIVSPDKANRSIIIKHVEKQDIIADGFKISANDKNQLIIECAYDNMLEQALSDYVTLKITSATGEVDLSSEFTRNISVLCYDDFGAKGDGATNDFEAIFNTHLKANECGQKVVATAGKTYYIESTLINGSPATATILTDTDWQGAKFIIDDRKIELHTETEAWGVVNIFKVESDYSTITVTDKAILSGILGDGLDETTRKFDLSAALGAEYSQNPYPVMITLKNSTHKIYRRRGYSNYSGSSMREVVVLDKNGNVDPETLLMWDYAFLTEIDIRRIDEKQITVENGEFTTRATQYNCIITKEDGTRDYEDPYQSRGMQIQRSNTVIRNVKHYVTDEKPFSESVDLATGKVLYVGLPYYGFYRIGSCNAVTLDSCVMTGRRCYIRPNGGTAGTYDMTVGTANKTVFKNCTQSNFWVTVDDNYNIKAATESTPGAVLGMSSFAAKVTLDSGTVQGTSMHWGVGGSNYAKNMTFDGSTISRYDAHDGMYNGKVINSTVQTIALTGAGEMIIKDTRIFPDDGDPRVFGVRSDYGSTFDGTVKIDNVSVFAPVTYKNGVAQNCFILERDRYTNWYYGYYTVVPNLEIKDVMFYDTNKYNSETQSFAAIPYGSEIYLYGKTTIRVNSALHLTEHKTASTELSPWYSIEDKDKDGKVDIPDWDGDGAWGNTEWSYSELKKALGSSYDKGYQDITSKQNFNIVIPPEYVKILSNKGGYIYTARNTALKANTPDEKTSNGLYHGVAENWKGFYGSTKFYYSETEYYQGPPLDGEKNPNESIYKFFE